MNKLTRNQNGKCYHLYTDIDIAVGARQTMIHFVIEIIQNI